MLTDTTMKRLDTLGILSRKGKRINGLFRLIENPTLWMQAYVNISANRGVTTKGVDGKSLDGFSKERVFEIVKSLKEGTYCFKPVKRVYIPKKNGKKKRPLGISSGDDKLVQEVVRIILDKIYEPIFQNSSHGFRPKKSCHTALMRIQQQWTSVKWMIDMDIESFFDTIDQTVLIELLTKKIDDKKFISLIELMLAAGYVEGWKFHRTYSGVPQGNIVSPMLANIYLHELDLMMNAIRAEFNCGEKRATNKAYRCVSESIKRYRSKIDQLKQQGSAMNQIQVIKKQIRLLDEKRKTMSAGMPFDPNYKRLFYCRYADDYVIGIIGSKQDAIHIQDKVKHFLQEKLHLNVSLEKSKLVHSQKGVRFLGYDMRVYSGHRVVKAIRGNRLTRVKSVSERIQLHIPQEKLRAFCHDKRYGNYDIFWSTDKPELCRLSDAEIVETYNAEMRGLANYYGLAQNAIRDLNKLVGVWQGSLFKTLARKHQTTVRKIARRLKTHSGHALTVHEKDKTRVFKVFSVKDISCEPSVSGRIDVLPNTWQFTLAHSELIQRLSGKQCEYCGSRSNKLEVHHVRALKDLKDQALWQIVMARRQRKTLILCVPCHKLLHTGKLPDWRKTRKEQMESRIN